MVCVRSAFVCATVALVATAGAFDADSHHRRLQVVNFRQEMLDEINAVRHSRKLPKFCMNKQLMYAAQVQANDMAEHNFTSSTGSDKSLPTERAARQGFKAELVTETVGAGFASASSIVAAWIKVASADSTLLSSTYNVMGPGYAFDRTKRWVHFWAVTYSEGTCEDDEKVTTPTTQTGGTSGGPLAGNDTKKKEGDARDDVDDDEPATPAPPRTNDAETPAEGSSNAEERTPPKKTTPAPEVPDAAPAPKTPDAAPAPEVPDAAPAPEVPDAAPAPKTPDAAPAPEVPDAAPAPKTPVVPGAVHAAPNAAPGAGPNVAPGVGPGTPITFDT